MVLYTEYYGSTEDVVLIWLGDSGRRRKLRDVGKEMSGDLVQ